MFGANRKKFMEGGLESDYADDSSLYYTQQSMFPPHRADKDMLASSSASSTGQLSQLGASLYGPQIRISPVDITTATLDGCIIHDQAVPCFDYIPHSALGFPMRGLNSSAASQLSRSGLNQSGSQLPSHASNTNSGTMHTPPSPSRGILPMSSRSVMNHNQQVGGPTGQSVGMVGVGGERGGAGGVGAGRSGSMGSPSRSSPSIIGMPKQQQARQPFTINSMSGFGVNRNPGFNMNNSLSNNIFNGTDGSENVTGLDLSDFPALADRSRRDGSSNPTPLLNPLAGRAPYVGMVTKPSSEQSQDFSIHNEDFPALPGPNYQTKDPTSTSEDSKTNLNSSGKSNSNSDGPKFPGDKSSAPSNNNQQKKGIQVLPDGRVTNIPVGMVTDQFGMIGLLTFIRAAETDPGMVHLALGSDLTTLGLNLNSPENLYPKFASPWASAPCRPQDIDFHVPSEYLTNIHIRDKLAAIKLSRYGEDLLFYLYYMNGGDLLQLLAAVELFNRDWRYHKEERVWITRAPGMEPTLKTNAYERGTYYFFDCLNWRKVAKEFHLEYDKLEERPHVPSAFNYNPAQQAV
ncbi:CCR4-NOT transcription complex subunit 2-like isoform X1 [Micropterus dolomieu]|uniref:CCR4-NOT transcription complex subunit 2-like isoform X1 n=1 Tax=Micropterus dolomieu TaxID=147949 RepID=UPI001E8DAD32|nr:CCR4-NOT transcription complex subunit 2-like isoform X1 [Micropterus dolomieu]XP_045895837.1 CCR4-NOT transcription complex subunit 2-like isoform X1 [Micropterus dolomieu]XP_045895838.1 CCR4-NOT transcription complex subunit 2-like isoform X1 [Micropterus dolomieu]